MQCILVSGIVWLPIAPVRISRLSFLPIDIKGASVLGPIDPSPCAFFCCVGAPQPD